MKLPIAYESCATESRAIIIIIAEPLVKYEPGTKTGPSKLYAADKCVVQVQHDTTEVLLLQLAHRLVYNLVDQQNGTTLNETHVIIVIASLNFKLKP